MTQTCQNLYLNGAPVSGDLIIPEGISSIGACAFYYNEGITSIVIPDGIQVIGDSTFNGCTSLTTLILRAKSMCTLTGMQIFTGGTHIQKGTGYIYGPGNLVEQYKSATNWSAYAAQIRAIEDYPDICGG